MKLSTLLATSIASTVAAASVQAQTTTYTAINNISDSNVAPAGPTYLLAQDFNGPGGEIFNGTTFAGSGTSGTANGVSYSLTGSGLAAYPGYNNSQTATGQANLHALISNFYYGGNNPNELLTFTGLTPGTTYTFNEYTAPFGTNNVGNREELISDTISPATSYTYEENTGNNYDELSVTFTTTNTGAATDTSDAFSFHATDAGGDTFHQYGFTLATAVPEPSTWLAAGGIVLLAAGDFRRRLKA